MPIAALILSIVLSFYCELSAHGLIYIEGKGWVVGGGGGGAGKSGSCTHHCQHYNDNLVVKSASIV